MQQWIDVSEFQGSVDWKKVAGKVKGAFIKVADGDKQDPTYAPERIIEVRGAKLTWGPAAMACGVLGGRRRLTRERSVTLIRSAATRSTDRRARGARAPGLPQHSPNEFREAAQLDGVRSSEPQSVLASVQA